MAKVKVLIIGSDNILDHEDIALEVCDKENKINKRIKGLSENPVDIIFLDLSKDENIFSDFFKFLDESGNLTHPPVFVLYDESDYKIRAEVWERPEVIGYSKKGDPETRKDIEKVIHELTSRRTSEASTGVTGRYKVGSVESIPPKDYMRFKFISLTVGRMREFMVDFKNVLSEINIKDTDSAQDPFLGVPVTCWFDYIFFKHNRPSDEGLMCQWITTGKNIHKIINNDDRNLERIPDSVADDKDNKFENMFKEIFCNEERIKREKFDSILIEGKTGTGKSLIADMIRQFFRKTHLEKITCTAIPSDLLEGELFGYMKGSYTNADATKPPKMVNAYDSFIFLDEIGDMDIRLQSKILTFLDNGRIEPIGWSVPGIPSLYIPARVIAATNKNLLDEIKKEKFREDLYYRFTHRITIPSLKERTEDIELLVDFILQNPDINPVINKERLIKSISKEAIGKIKTHEFDGNYRELEFIIHEAVKKAKRFRSDVILPDDIVFQQKEIL